MRDSFNCVTARDEYLGTVAELDQRVSVRLTLLEDALIAGDQTFQPPPVRRI